MKKYISLFIMSLVFVSNAYAARPLATDDAGAADVGALELEYGYEYVNATDKEYNHSVVLKTGVLKNLDLGVEIPYQFIDLEDEGDTNGFSDIVIMSKWNILHEQERLPDFALSFAYKTESGNDEKSLGTGRPEYTFTGIFSKQFNKITYYGNLGCSVKKEFEDTFNYCFALEYSLNEKINLVGEIFGDTLLSGKFDDNATSGLVGLNYAINDAVTYDLGLASGISEAEPDYKVSTGFTFAFGG
ncbi:MAG: transporter [Candidatus Omnitrophica bacterium]|nr:transporter [Candidatus Omnitrophota bacterium]